MVEYLCCAVAGRFDARVSAPRLAAGRGGPPADPEEHAAEIDTTRSTCENGIPSRHQGFTHLLMVKIFCNSWSGCI